MLPIYDTGSVVAIDIAVVANVIGFFRFRLRKILYTNKGGNATGSAPSTWYLGEVWLGS